MIEDLLQRSGFTVGIILVLSAFLASRIRLLIQLRHIKGPFLQRITGIPHSLAFLGDDGHNWYNTLSQKYGQLVVVSPTMLLTSSPDLWARMNTHPGYVKSKWFYHAARFDWRGDNIFTQTSIEKHDERRNQMIRGYSGAENLTLEADIEFVVAKLLHLIRSRYAGQRKSMDLAQKIQFFALDVISAIGFGECFHLLDADDDPNNYVNSIREGLSVVCKQAALGTWWLNSIPFIGPKPNLDLKTTNGFYRIASLHASMVEAREKEFHEQKKSGVVPRADMLTSFMKKGLFGIDLKIENLLQIVAGSDTAAGSLRAILLYVMANPRVYKTLQAEIDSTEESGLVSQAPQIVKFSQVKECVYLQAVIKEGMRIFSPINTPLSRNTPPGGDTVTIDGDEIYLPGGIQIIPSFKAMHRNKSVYGRDSDVEVFRPERWLEERDEKKLEAMKREHHLMFGDGRWQCLGKAIAMRELSIVTFELFRNFEWTLVNPEKPWKDLNLFGLHSTSDMWVQVEERKQLRPAI
ncbi:hypothetical protein NUW58_g941 [Xylaria curta]|uniref:Uncharacterized protein n=1 Tax=Xylaria curta TaxID=42375 RepID=A0ACC1PMB6_9PEZI|nr:hypothetical protein NUW58_g941 [Xylaria curta]